MSTLKEIEEKRRNGEISWLLPIEAVKILVDAAEEAKRYPLKER